jgi:hypothetical protein
MAGRRDHRLQLVIVATVIRYGAGRQEFVQLQAKDRVIV